jgi:dTDP-4-dehydrorhamnose 3,5-epimerase
VIFERTKLVGVFAVRAEPVVDHRGAFARTFCAREFRAAGLDPEIVQRSVSRNPRRGTLRGMHFQAPPHAENKLVSCDRGAIFDVVLDLRPGSETYRAWLGLTLEADDGVALFVPSGCAHGFLTLADDTVVSYAMSSFHEPAAARGVRYDDPAFGVAWPFAPVVISERDLGYPAFGDPASGGGR